MKLFISSVRVVPTLYVRAKTVNRFKFFLMCCVYWHWSSSEKFSGLDVVNKSQKTVWVIGSCIVCNKFARNLLHVSRKFSVNIYKLSAERKEIGMLYQLKFS